MSCEADLEEVPEAEVEALLPALPLSFKFSISWKNLSSLVKPPPPLLSRKGGDRIPDAAELDEAALGNRVFEEYGAGSNP